MFKAQNDLELVAFLSILSHFCTKATCVRVSIQTAGGLTGHQHVARFVHLMGHGTSELVDKCVIYRLYRYKWLIVSYM